MLSRSCVLGFAVVLCLLPTAGCAPARPAIATDRVEVAKGEGVRGEFHRLVRVNPDGSAEFTSGPRDEYRYVVKPGEWFGKVERESRRRELYDFQLVTTDAPNQKATVLVKITDMGRTKRGERRP